MKGKKYTGITDGRNTPVYLKIERMEQILDVEYCSVMIDGADAFGRLKRIETRTQERHWWLSKISQVKSLVTKTRTEEERKKEVLEIFDEKREMALQIENAKERGEYHRRS